MRKDLSKRPLGFLALFAAFVLIVSGCNEPAENPAIDMSVAASFKAGCKLDEIVAKLGEPNEITGAQLEKLNANSQRMFQRDYQIESDCKMWAWGTNSKFLVAQVNNDGKVVRTSRQSSN